MSTATVPLQLTENPELHDVLQLMIVPQYKDTTTSITGGFVQQPRNKPTDPKFQASNPAKCYPAASHLAMVWQGINTVKKATVVCLFLITFAFAAEADIIYFKDGLKTVCQQRAWEEGDQIKCEFGGYIISYQKSDVLRILQTTRPKPNTKSKNDPQIPKKSQSARKDAAQTSPSKVAGNVFYDPRRPHKYWSANNRKHKTYEEAIQALANRYKRTPEWIKANMGNTNDLAEIHRNLAAPEPASGQTINPVEPARQKHPEIEFYNPRRSSPYWTSASKKHKSFKEAIQAFAKEFNRSPEWIQEYMGQTNDLAEIRSNLRSRQSMESSKWASPMIDKFREIS